VDIGRDGLFLGDRKEPSHTHADVPRERARLSFSRLGNDRGQLGDVRIHLLRDGDDVGDIAAQHLHLVAQLRQREGLAVTVTFEILLRGRQRAKHVLALCAKVPQPGGCFVWHNVA
jgi:hypothetical protein